MVGAMLMRLAIDYEHPSRRWWESGGQELWDGIREDVDGGADLVLDESLARSWLEEAARIPGWEDGPEYAPHPVRLQPVADDEDV